MLKVSKKLFLLPIVLGVLTAGFAVSTTSSKVGAQNDHDADSIVGAWVVDAAAPYRPHLFTFNQDGTMLSTNPTNVQENSSEPHGGTNDSVGMGTWRVEKKDGVKYVVGTFEELNAFADNHHPADTLSVSFKVTVNNDVFDGPAQATLGSLVQGSHVRGTRIIVDQSAVDGL